MKPLDDPWKMIRTIHASTQKVPPAIVDLIAVFDILTACVRGYSIDRIAEELEMDAKYVESVLLEYFDFPGWYRDLSVNLYNVFKSTKQDFDGFYSAVSKLSGSFIKDLDITKCYKICYTYHRLRKELGQYGY